MNTGFLTTTISQTQRIDRLAGFQACQWITIVVNTIGERGGLCRRGSLRACTCTGERCAVATGGGDIAEGIAAQPEHFRNGRLNLRADGLKGGLTVRSSK